MTHIKAVVFDFDGTLVDTMGGFADIAANVMAKRFGMDWNLARRRYLETSGLPFRQQLDVIFPDDSRNDAASDEFEATKQEGFFAEHFSDDVNSTLKQLATQGLRVIVSSNNFQELVDRFVAREDIQFSIVLGARENFFKGRDHFVYIMSSLGIESSDLLFVGDSLKDAERAHENGVAFVGRTGTFTKAEFQTSWPGIATIDNLSDLLEILK